MASHVLVIDIFSNQGVIWKNLLYACKQKHEMGDFRSWINHV